MQAHLLYHTKNWRSCRICTFVINLHKRNYCIKYLPHLGNQGLSMSNNITLSDTQLCNIMMHGCWKEWADQYDADVDALLEKFKTYKKLD